MDKPVNSPSLKTPTAGDALPLADSTVIDIPVKSPKPSSTGLEAIDLDIKNLEGTPKIKHQHSVSMTNVPSDAGRKSHTRRYSLDLAPTTARDHAALAADNEQKRKSSERIFKIMVILVIFIIIGLITGLMMAWELGYFNKQEGFSAPIFY